MKIGPSQIFEVDFFDLDFSIFHTISNDFFEKMIFSKILISKKLQKIIENCMKNGKIEIEKKRSQNF